MVNSLIDLVIAVAKIMALQVVAAVRADAVPAAVTFHGVPLDHHGIAGLMLLPLGLVLGTFMPIGLGAVSRLTHHRSEYVAGGRAVNGFFSVMGSILATILSMAYGFRFLLFLALLLYVVAGLSLHRLEPASADDAVG